MPIYTTRPPRQESPMDGTGAGLRDVLLLLEGKGRASSTQQTVNVSAIQAKHDCGNATTQGTWRDAPLSLICEAIMSK